MVPRLHSYRDHTNSTGPGLYTATLSATSTADILCKPSLLPYPSFDDSISPAFSRAPASSPLPPPIPLSITITQWHWLLLYDDRLVAIARENEKIVWEETLPLVCPTGADNTVS